MNPYLKSDAECAVTLLGKRYESIAAALPFTYGNQTLVLGLMLQKFGAHKDVLLNANIHDLVEYEPLRWWHYFVPRKLTSESQALLDARWLIQSGLFVFHSTGPQA